MNLKNCFLAFVLVGLWIVWTGLAIWSFDIAFGPYCPSYPAGYVEQGCPRGIDRAPN